MQDLGVVISVISPYVQGWCLFVSLGFTNTFFPLRELSKGLRKPRVVLGHLRCFDTLDCGLS